MSSSSSSSTNAQSQSTPAAVLPGVATHIDATAVSTDPLLELSRAQTRADLDVAEQHVLERRTKNRPKNTVKGYKKGQEMWKVLADDRFLSFFLSINSADLSIELVFRSKLGGWRSCAREETHPIYQRRRASYKDKTQTKAVPIGAHRTKT